MLENGARPSCAASSGGETWRPSAWKDLVAALYLRELELTFMSVYRLDTNLNRYRSASVAAKHQAAIRLLTQHDFGDSDACARSPVLAVA